MVREQTRRFAVACLAAITGQRAEGCAALGVQSGFRTYPGLDSVQVVGRLLAWSRGCSISGLTPARASGLASES